MPYDSIAYPNVNTIWTNKQLQGHHHHIHLSYLQQDRQPPENPPQRLKCTTVQVINKLISVRQRQPEKQDHFRCDVTSLTE